MMDADVIEMTCDRHGGPAPAPLPVPATIRLTVRADDGVLGQLVIGVDHGAIELADVEAAPAQVATVVDAVLGWLETAAPTQGLLRAFAPAPTVVGRLVARGCAPVGAVSHFTQDLTTFDTTAFDAAPPVFRFTSLEALGVAPFAAAVARAATGATHPMVRTVAPERLFEHLQASGSHPHAPAWWQVAHRGTTAVGVVMPGLVDATPDIGGLVFFGVFPEFRGRGIGGVLHLHALAALRRLGVTTYVETTASDDVAMRRVLLRNGACSTGDERWYRRVFSRRGPSC